MKMPKPFIRPAQPRIPRIELDTPIVPRAVMELVCEEAGLWLGQPLPRRWIRELTARANTIYAHNPLFRRKIRGQGNSGRDYLWTFARHWLSGLISEHHPHAYPHLPASFNIGQPLPTKPPVPHLRLKTARKIPPPTKRRPRPAPDYAFAAAAHFSFPS